ncbi:hypothetical protein GF420_11155, partial [candidate division GN15 bacterium]|nr:hypothetical protein [candidate division GN15 bacterium]
MSWKDLKIAKKLYIGFGIVIALAIAVGYVGWNGLGTVSEKVTNATDAHTLNAWVKDMAAARQKFLAKKDVTVYASISETLDKMYERMEVTTARFKDPADVKLMADATKLLQEYDKDWQEMVRIQNEIEAAIAEMDKAAAVAVERVANLEEGQRQKLQDDLAANLSNSAIRERTQKFDDAGTMRALLLNSRIRYRDFRRTEEDQYAEALNATIDQLLEKCVSTRKLMKDAEDIKRVDDVS